MEKYSISIKECINELNRNKDNYKEIKNLLICSSAYLQTYLINDNISKDKTKTIFWHLMKNKDKLKPWLSKDIPWFYRLLIKLKILELSISGHVRQNKIFINASITNKWNYEFYFLSKEYKYES